MYVRVVWLAPFLSMTFAGCEDVVAPGAADVPELGRAEAHDGLVESTDGPTPYSPPRPPQITEGVTLHVLKCNDHGTVAVGLQTNDIHQATVVHCGPYAEFADMNAIKAEAMERATQECVDRMRSDVDGSDDNETHAYYCEDGGECRPAICKEELVNSSNSDTETTLVSLIGYRPSPGLTPLSWWPADVPHTPDFACYKVVIKCTGGFTASFSCPCC